MKTKLSLILAVVAMALIFSSCSSSKVVVYDDAAYGNEENKKGEKQRLKNFSYGADLTMDPEKDNFELNILQETEELQYHIRYEELTNGLIEITKVDLNGVNTQLVFDGQYNIKDAKSKDYLLLAVAMKEDGEDKDTLVINSSEIVADIKKRLKRDKKGVNKYTLNNDNIDFPEFNRFEIPEVKISMWYFILDANNPERTFCIDKNDKEVEILVNFKTGNIVFVSPNGIYRWYNFTDNKRSPLSKKVAQQTSQGKQQTSGTSRVGSTRSAEELQDTTSSKKMTRKERKAAEKAQKALDEANKNADLNKQAKIDSETEKAEKETLRQKEEELRKAEIDRQAKRKAKEDEAKLKAELESNEAVDEEPKTTTHIVKKGETIWKLTQDYGVSKEEIIEWNDLTSTVLSIDQELIIHIKE